MGQWVNEGERGSTLCQAVSEQGEYGAEERKQNNMVTYKVQAEMAMHLFLLLRDSSHS